MTDLEKNYLDARLSRIRSEHAGLNSAQLQAVMATEGPLLILAGAGSGKTTVLIHRIQNLLRYGRASDSDEITVPVSENTVEILRSGSAADAAAVGAVEPPMPWQILAITFTNKAAGELKSRLADAIGPGAEDVWAMTFHSCCVRILRRCAAEIGYGSDFTIYDSGDSQSLVKHILKDRNLDEKVFPPRSVLSAVSRAKDALQMPEEMLAEVQKTGDVRKIRIAEIYREYQNRLRDANAMDFDDLILNTVLLLQTNEDVRSYYQQKFRYVLVDEYQDTNHLQFLLTRLLSGGRNNLCVVGDDDQSIYKFRGATIRNILEFEQDLPNARVLKLEQNYRSTGHILAAANAVIANNRGRKGKILRTDAEDGILPFLYVAPNDDSEAQYVAERLMTARAAGGEWRDNAVLYRINAQSNRLEFALKRRGIPYRVYGGMKFFDRAEIKDVLAYLCVIANPSDDLRLLRIINRPARGIGNKTVDTVSVLAAENGCSVYDVLSRASEYPALQRSAAKLSQFSSLIEDLRSAEPELPLDELYGAVLEKTGYLSALREDDAPDSEARIENVEELRSNIVSFMKENETPTLAGFLDEVALYTDLDGMDADTDCVSLMTIHSAKGLEFPTVFLVGAEENLFPGIKSIGDEAEMEEERRLCYVAITRAKRQLVITCATSRMLFGKTSSSRVSRFVEEIPPEHLERSHIPQGYRYSDPPRGMESFSRPLSRPTSRPVRPVLPTVSQTEKPDFSIGDRVSHRAFGEGTIAAMTAMGGDYLVEIDFDTPGRKRLMLKAAAKLMKKL